MGIQNFVNQSFLKSTETKRTRKPPLRDNAAPSATRGRPQGTLKPRYGTVEELPMRLRPRDICHVFPISPAQFRKAIRTGGLKPIGTTPDRHPYYLTNEVREYFNMPILDVPLWIRKRIESARVFAPRSTIYPPLLRLRIVNQIGFSRDMIESLCRSREITPFYKTKSSKALYRTWQFNRLFGSDFLKIKQQPGKRQLRRGEVARWLSVPCAEVESWLPGVIKRHSASGKLTRRGWGYFDRDEIKRKILGQNASKMRK